MTGSHQHFVAASFLNAVYRMCSFLVLIVGCLSSAQSESYDCTALSTRHLPNATIVRAEPVRNGSLAIPGAAPILDLPPFCRVVVTLTPSSDSEIHAEVWLPETTWNGRMEGTGNGGFAGSIRYTALAQAMKLGYAVVNSDMGMAPPLNKTASAFVNRPERWADWGYRATHQMTLAARQVILAYYGRNPRRSYFAGCSTGGEQALMEAQRFPEDYDGIVAGAPANNRTGVHTSILWNFAVTRRNPSSQLSDSQISLLASEVLSRCDLLDGVQDGIIADPRSCKFDPEALQCSKKRSGDCLTAEQVETVRRIYAGPQNPRTGAQLYPGLPRGSELGWIHFGPPRTSPQVPPFEPIFQWTFGPNWSWRTFDFDSNFAQMKTKLEEPLNAVNPDLSKFQRLGHKLIVYHGWADWLVPPEESIAYLRAVQASEAAQGRDETGIGEFYRLFMVPGMQHCGGGPGAEDFDALESVVSWVEDGTKPDRILATGHKTDTARHAFQRPLCPYPLQESYDGFGDTSQASSYVCSQTK